MSWDSSLWTLSYEEKVIDNNSVTRYWINFKKYAPCCTCFSIYDKYSAQRVYCDIPWIYANCTLYCIGKVTCYSSKSCIWINSE